MKTVNEFIENNKELFFSELFDLLKIPSISADSNYFKDILSATEYIENQFKKIGCENIEIHKTEGCPIVYAEKIIDETLPTVLIYGHYDVQPADPIELWDSAPFEPIIKETDIHPEGAIFARGSSDDKGQFFMHLKAIQYLIEENKLKCNVKFMIEGEEEIEVCKPWQVYFRK